MLQKLVPDQKRRKKFCLAWDDFLKWKIMSKSVLLKVSRVKEEGVRSELSGRGHDANQPWSTIKRGRVCVCVRAFSEGFLLHVSCVEENIWRTYGPPLLGLNFPLSFVHSFSLSHHHSTSIFLILLDVFHHLFFFIKQNSSTYESNEHLSNSKIHKQTHTIF